MKKTSDPVAGFFYGAMQKGAQPVSCLLNSAIDTGLP